MTTPPDHDRDRVVAAIDAERRRRGLSYQALAERAGTSASTLHHYLAGRKQPGLAVLRRICDALGLDLRAIRR